MTDRWTEARDRSMRERAWRGRQDGRDASGSGEDRSWDADLDYGDDAADYGRPSQITRGGPGGRTDTARGDRHEYGGRGYGGDRFYGGERSQPAYQAGGYDGYQARPGYADEDRYAPRRDPQAGGGFGSGETQRQQGGERDSFMYKAGERVASLMGGGHKGKGPKGYQRSDERINEEVHERLTEDHNLDATHIAVAVASGEVTLSGTADSREARHHAERLVENISGVQHVQNNIRVGTSPSTGSGAGYGSGYGQDSVLDAQAHGKTGDQKTI